MATVAAAYVIVASTSTDQPQDLPHPPRHLTNRQQPPPPEPKGVGVEPRRVASDDELEHASDRQERDQQLEPVLGRQVSDPDHVLTSRTLSSAAPTRVGVGIVESSEFDSAHPTMRFTATGS
jgi:hypothetical protein